MLVLDKIAIVTGGSRGIGETEARVLFEQGATVIVGDLSIPFTEKLVKKNESDTGAIYESNLDVSDKTSVNRFCNAVIDRFGRIDILINNAGICPPLLPFETVQAEEWQNVFDVNLMGTVNCTSAVIPVMKKQKYGKIINTSSIAGEIGGKASSVCYSASKASIICITKVLAKYLGEYGITVNAVSPGYIITEMTKNHKQDLSTVPLGRRGEPVEVANTVLFLASELSSYITGATIGVNGGVHMK